MSHRPLRGSWVPEAPTPGKYRCQRCGIEKLTKPTRRQPELCADCKSVLGTLPAAEEEPADDTPDPPAHSDDPDDSDDRDGPGPDRRPTAAVSA